MASFDPIDTGYKLFGLAWRWNFRIPRLALLLVYSLGILTAVGAYYIDQTWLWAVSGLLVLIGVTGLIRWAQLMNPAPALVIPLFSSEARLRDKAEEIQRLIVQALHDHLTGSFPLEAIKPIPVVVGLDMRQTALRLKRRAHALYLIYGDVRQSDGGQVSVWARLLTTSSEIWHFDPHTKEFLPYRTGLRDLFRRLTPLQGIESREYPLGFTSELEALLRSVIAEIVWFFGDWKTAENHLRSALEIVAASESQAVDHLRLRLADCLFDSGRREEALDFLRGRAAESSASSELLTHLAALIGIVNDPTNPAGTGRSDDGLVKESEALLRRALEDRTSPSRRTTQYNLAMVLIGGASKEEEGYQLLEELVRGSDYYSRAWYVHGPLGARHWYRSEQLMKERSTTKARAEARIAASHYRKMLRYRPKFRLSFRGKVPVVRRFPTRPILHANAFDAYQRSGFKFRAAFQDWRTNQLRRRELARGERGLALANWPMAMAHFDWAIVGRRDAIDIFASVGKATALERMGHTRAARELLDETIAFDEQAARRCQAWISQRYLSDSNQ